MNERNLKMAQRRKKKHRAKKGRTTTTTTTTSTTSTTSQTSQDSILGNTTDIHWSQAVHMLNEGARIWQQHQQHNASAPASPSAGRRRPRREVPALATTTSPGSGKSKKKKRRRQGRRKRMYDVRGYRYRRSCGRHKMYVDFDEIGWSGWIISPKGYDAYHCSGECPFPLGQSQRPTNHATVQSIVHALRVGSKLLGTPCCVPNKLFSISLLYFDDDENVILKQYDDMVAATCGCH